jgi:hypothetical protein
VKRGVWNKSQQENQDDPEPPEVVLKTLPVRRACAEINIVAACFNDIAKL